MCDILDYALAGRDDLSEEKAEALAHVKWHGCYSKLALSLLVRVLFLAKEPCWSVRQTCGASFSTEFLGIGMMKCHPLYSYQIILL